MVESLCGQYPCPGICVRVCHCPAGLERSKEQFAMYRNRRLVLRSGLRAQGGLPSEQWHEVEFVSQARQSPGALNQPERKKPSQFFPTHNYHQAAVPYTRLFNPFASWAFLMGLLVFMGIVVLLGLAINGGDFAPGYEPPQISYYENYR